MTTPVNPALDLAADLEACKAWVDREEHASDIVTPELVKRFRATLDLPDRDAAVGDPAALAIHWCLSPPALPTSALGRDGHPELGGFLPPIPLPRRMWAGGELTMIRPIRVGDTVQRVSRIGDIVLKEGRTGPLCFVTVRHVYSLNGSIAVDERQDIVYRRFDAKPGATPANAPPPSLPAVPKWTASIAASEVLLFRYSALTFNGHRIHYDRRFCVEQEGYPGLVVHGPLQATLLLHFAAGLRGGAAPTSFVFRSSAPLFDGSPFSLNAVELANGLRLWTAGPDGQPAMSAEATW